MNSETWGKLSVLAKEIKKSKHPLLEKYKRPGFVSWNFIPHQRVGRRCETLPGDSFWVLFEAMIVSNSMRCLTLLALIVSTIFISK